MEKYNINGQHVIDFIINEMGENCEITINSQELSKSGDKFEICVVNNLGEEGSRIIRYVFDEISMKSITYAMNDEDSMSYSDGKILKVDDLSSAWKAYLMERDVNYVDYLISRKKEERSETARRFFWEREALKKQMVNLRKQETEAMDGFSEEILVLENVKYKLTGIKPYVDERTLQEYIGTFGRSDIDFYEDSCDVNEAIKRYISCENKNVCERNSLMLDDDDFIK